MKKLFTLLACIISLHAMAINLEEATLVTQNFLKEKNITKESSLSEISLKDIVRKEGMDMFYVMNLGNDEGFVIVPASKYLPPIFGYSFENEFELHPAIQFYLDVHSRFILHEEKNKNTPDVEITKKWEHFLLESFTSNNTRTTTVGPLITSRWNQDKFYNTYCPWDRASGASSDYRVPNGCVALCGAQLMNYYRHPKQGKLTFSYIPFGYSQQIVYASQQYYNWDAMCDRATNYTNEIAKLAYHLGVAVQMNYAPGGSGSSTEKLIEMLNKNYDYSFGQVWSTYDTVTFKREIDALRPIIMSGCDKVNCESGGHAFLVDGYEEPGIMFHFNWGWGGYADGYFYLANYLNHSQYFQYSALSFIKLSPQSNYPAQCQQFKRQTAYQGYITNGSTNQPYQETPDCSWMIAARGATRYNFTFSRLDTQENIDVITIYNGPTVSSGVAATYSGTGTPQGVIVNADSVLITFTSTNPTSRNTTHLGFLMGYTTDKPAQKCDVMTDLTTSSGYITDGYAVGETYTPWISCTWNIAPNYNTGFFGLFHEFDLRLGDFVDIYNAATNPPTFWKRFEIAAKPTLGEVFSIPFLKIQVKFITDNYDEGQGFKFQYFSMLGVNNNSLLDNLAIYPNPASDVINLSFSSELVEQSINCRIVDITGRELYAINIEYNGDVYATQIPVAHFAKGIYFLQLTTTTGTVTSKVIIN